MGKDAALKKEKLEMKKIKEIARRKAQLEKPKPKGYFWYLMVVLSLVYITDEVASQIMVQNQSNIVNEFFVQNMGLDYGTGLSYYQLLTFISIPVMLLTLIYKPLSDKMGRKPFLVINTALMGAGMFIIFLSQNIWVYFIGMTVITFFIMHDMHCVYILETAPENRRGTLYSISKCVVVLGTLFIPLMRTIFMKNDSSKWHLVFLVPALFAFVIAFIALLCARETDAFLIKRIEMLEMSDEEKERIKKEDAAKAAQGGIITAFKFSFTHRQLRNLLITSFLFTIASIATSTYNTVLSESYGLSETQITTVLFFYPFGNAFFTLISGFFSDRLGRKQASVIMSVCAIASYILMLVGLICAFPNWLIGLFIGAFVGAYWSAGDTVGGIMHAESAPTNLRSSVTTVQFIISNIGGLLGQLAAMILQTFIATSAFGIMYTLIAVPSMALALIVLVKNVGETRGLDLKEVTGAEWDKPKKKESA